MELRHLRYFVAVAEEEHVTRAAFRLGIQQPPLSQQIQALEDELGVKLFVRSARTIRLSATGKFFLSEARKILAQSEQAIERVRRFDLGEEGRLRIGFTSSSSMHGATRSLIRAFRAAYPLIAVEIDEGATHDLLCEVEQEHLDVAFIRSDVTRYPALATISLLEEEMVVALPAEHPLAIDPRERITLSELRDESFILYRQINGSGIANIVLDACEREGFVPKVVGEPSRLMSALYLVATGIGISVMPKSMVQFLNSDVVYKSFEATSNPRVPVNIAYRKAADSVSMIRFLTLANEARRLQPL
ncbi:LysR substrate-binding domain-containing protein [Trinickia mobilis]|uniref:LysR substrate-binding domain-containing protein n=1 Tax=Trinickia mobilis TaxID=2816356 RepID=UPI001A8E7897|nr:LysR substrate-binding domain-containing protein [Trinickia mobilis]